MKKNKKQQQAYVEDYANVKFGMFFEEIEFMRLNFLDTLSAKIKTLKSNGLFMEQIAKQIYNDFCDDLDKLRNNEIDELWDLNKSVSQKTVFSQMDEDALYEWQWEEGANHCEDCKERNGKRKTFQQWENEGLPGSGVTKCGYNCLCDLIEIQKKS
jgi:hypothetical protein